MGKLEEMLAVWRYQNVVMNQSCCCGVGAAVSIFAQKRHKTIAITVPNRDKSF